MSVRGVAVAAAQRLSSAWKKSLPLVMFNFLLQLRTSFRARVPPSPQQERDVRNVSWTVSACVYWQDPKSHCVVCASAVFGSYACDGCR